MFIKEIKIYMPVKLIIYFHFIGKYEINPFLFFYMKKNIILLINVTFLLPLYQELVFYLKKMLWNKDKIS